MCGPEAHIRLTPATSGDLLDHYRRSTEPDVRLRAHLLTILADDDPWATTRDLRVNCCSPG